MDNIRTLLRETDVAFPQIDFDLQEQQQISNEDLKQFFAASASSWFFLFTKLYGSDLTG